MPKESSHAGSDAGLFAPIPNWCNLLCHHRSSALASLEQVRPDPALAFPQMVGSIAVLVHRIALEMKQSVSMFGSPSHAGWHLQVKDSIETDGATIFLMAFTFLHPDIYYYYN